MNLEKIVPVILCGGIGTRLWPLSRESFPKQYINLKKNSHKTLLQNTYERLSNLENLDNPILICNEKHRFLTAEQIREINVKPKSILLEQVGRGTGPAAALAAIKATEQGENPYLLLLSSDHFIENELNFIKSIKEGLYFAKDGRLVTFGVVPDSPETGYGYIETKEQKNIRLSGLEIKRFIEKPNLKSAEEFLTNKRFLWNSGIFLFKALDILKELEKFEPDIVKNCKDSLYKNDLDFDFQRINNTYFSKCRNISLDVAIMERTKLGTVIPLVAGWKDIGSWNNVWENSKKDFNNNASEGKVFLEDCQDSYFRSESRLLVGFGIKDVVAIETSDAVLVLNKNKSQNIKEIVSTLKKKNFKESFEHQKIFRPWGSYTFLVEDRNWKVKKIVVNPYQSLSLQLHHKRVENWVVVSGIAKVEINGKISLLSENKSAFIPKGAKHRLSNPTDYPLILIEVQSGEIIDEKDIVRFKDDYGRVDS